MNRLLSLTTTTTNRVVNSSLLLLLQRQSRIHHLPQQSRVLFGTSTTPTSSSTIEKIGNDVFSIANVPQTPRFKLYKSSSTMPPLVTPLEVLGRDKCGCIWVNNVYPIKIHRYDFRDIFVGNFAAKVRSILPSEVDVVQITRVEKEGGVYVFFRPLEGKTLEETSDIMLEYLKTHRFKMFPFASRPPKGHLVRGKPFVEDITTRFPSFTCFVTFKSAMPGVPNANAEALSQDALYKCLRPYGRIFDIEFPSRTNKDDAPRCIVRFERIEGAVATKNCLHGSRVNDTQLFIQCDIFQPAHHIQDMFAKHPRIMIPLLGIIITLIGFLLLDPIREWFITEHITRPLHIDKDKTPSSTERKNTKTARSKLWWLGHKHDEEEKDQDLNMVKEREVDVSKVNRLFGSQPYSLLLIAAPRGSGKSSFIKQILQGRSNVSVVDFPTRGVNEEEFVNLFAEGIHFYPSYSFINVFTTWADSILPSSKHAFASNTISQVNQMLDCFEASLKKVAEHSRAKEQEGAVGSYPIVVFDGFHRMIQNFENKEKAQVIQDCLVDWAIEMTTKQIAHIVFVSDDPFASHTMRKYTERKSGRLEVVTLDLLSNDATKVLLKNRLGEVTPEDLSIAADKLGGHLPDILTFTNKIRSGLAPKAAISQMIQEAIVIIRSEGFGMKGTADVKEKSTAKLVRAPLWETIRIISAQGSVSYDHLLFTVFQGDEKALNSLVKANILRIVHKPDTGKMDRVVPATPLYFYAFKKMVSDPQLSKGMDIAVRRWKIAEEMSRINSYEDELCKLRTLLTKNYFGVENEPAAVGARRKLVETKLQQSNTKVEKWEAELSLLVKEIYDARVDQVTVTPRDIKR